MISQPGNDSESDESEMKFGFPGLWKVLGDRWIANIKWFG